jgi:hypothetical protein
MTEKLSTLLLIALMLALPLRVGASVSMAGCASCHHGAAVDACRDMGQGQQNGTHDHCHDDGASPVTHAPSSCSACGDCCVGVVSLPSAPQTTSDASISTVLVSSIDDPYPAFEPEGPDRPPRHAVF